MPVQFDEIFQTFDPLTRRAIQGNLVGIGNTLAGRGSALNDTISTLPELLRHLEPVAANLSAPSTRLTLLIRSLNVFMGTVAPVAPIAAQLFTDMATTFEAISRDPNALAASIAETPSTLAVGTDSLAVQQPFLANLTVLGNKLQPATASAPGRRCHCSTPRSRRGSRRCPKRRCVNANLQHLLSAVQQLALAPGTNQALIGLTSTVSTLNPMVRYLGPYQTVCNDWNYWWTYLADHLSAQTEFGFAQRALLNLAAPSDNSVGQQGATTPVNGTSGSDQPPLTVFGGQQFLHAQSYGAAVDTHGNADCETGQRGFPKKLNPVRPRTAKPRAGPAHARRPGAHL